MKQFLTDFTDNLEIINAGSNYSDYPKDSLFEVDAAGMGCMLVKTKVLKDIAGYYKTIFEPQNLIGEDIAFCQRAKKLGYEVWCDSRIKCGHVGVSIITEDTYNVAQEIKAVEEAEKLNENNIASVKLIKIRTAFNQVQINHSLIGKLLSLLMHQLKLLYHSLVFTGEHSGECTCELTFQLLLILFCLQCIYIFIIFSIIKTFIFFRY